MRRVNYPDLTAKYENPIEHAYGHTEVFERAGSHDGWMKDPRSAMISCNDGFRPVSFLIKALDEDSDQLICNE